MTPGRPSSSIPARPGHRRGRGRPPAWSCPCPAARTRSGHRRRAGAHANGPRAPCGRSPLGRGPGAGTRSPSRSLLGGSVAARLRPLCPAAILRGFRRPARASGRRSPGPVRDARRARTGPPACSQIGGMAMVLLQARDLGLAIADRQPEITLSRLQLAPQMMKQPSERAGRELGCASSRVSRHHASRRCQGHREGRHNSGDTQL